MQFLKKKNNYEKQKGFTLIEVAISLAILSVLSVGVYSLIIFSLKITAENKFHAEAIEVANQKIEIIRNMPYTNVGVVSGIPNGTIPQIETISRNNINFTINTYITYFDDTYDGTAPTDTIPTDYKIVTVKVSWNTRFGSKNLTVFSKVIPRTEETDEGYGLLKLFVVDSNSIAVPNASVHTVSALKSIDVTNITDASGILYLPAPETTDYKITVTKAGYGTDYTFDPTTGMTPTHLAVTVGNKKEESFSIDKLAVVDIKTFSDNLPDNWQVDSGNASNTKNYLATDIDTLNNMYFTWMDASIASSTVYVQKYNSSKIKQWASDLAINNTNHQKNPDITTLANGSSFIVWYDNSVTLKQTASIDSEINNNYAIFDIKEFKTKKFIAKDKKLFLANYFNFWKNNFRKISNKFFIYQIQKDFFKPKQATAAEVGTIVQTKIGSTFNNLTTSMTATFDNPPTPGNVIIAIATRRENDGNFNVPNNTTGNFTEAIYQQSGTYDIETGIWYKVVGIGEPKQVNITANFNMRGGNLMLMEVSNLDTTNLIDVVASNDQSTSNSNTANTNSTAISADNGFAVAAINFADNNFTTPNSSDWSSISSNAWTQRMWVDWWKGRDNSLAVATLDVSTAAAQRATLSVGGAGGEQRISAIAIFNTVSPDEVAVASIGSQTSSMMIPSTNQEVGGTFSITDLTGSHTVTNITISENGTVDAQNDISKVALFYDIDSSTPYDCVSENFDSTSDIQFGSNQLFSSTDGVATFSDSVNIDTNNTLCLYALVDITTTADKNDTLEILITNPSTDITSDASNITPATTIEIASTTNLLLPAKLEQVHYRFRNDDGDEITASWRESLNTPTLVKVNSPLRLRFEYSNIGSLASANTKFQLEYGEKNTTCNAIAVWNPLPTDNSLHWKISDSANITDGSPSTNIAGIIDENITFLAGELKDTNNQSSALSLTGSEFTDFEFSITATNNATDQDYCFRLTNAGSVANMLFTIYAEASIIGDNNIYLKKIDSSGNTLWAVKKVNSNMDNSDQINPQVAATENFGNATTVVAWIDERNGNQDIYMQSFDSSGNKLWTNDLQITSSSTAENDIDLNIDSNDNIFITWVENSDIYLQKYNLYGTNTYANPLNLSNSSNLQSNPIIQFDSSNNIYLSWTTNQTSIDSIILTKYDTNLVSLWSMNPNLEEPVKNQSDADFKIKGNDIYISWTDSRKGNNDIYTQRLDTSGNYIWTKDQKINNDPGTAIQEKPVLIINGLGNTFASWIDERNINPVIYATEFVAPGASVAKANVPLVLTGTKKISLTPLVYEYDKIVTTDGSGIATVQLEWDKEPGYNIIAHSASTTLNVSSCDPVCPFEVQPGEIKTINVYVQ